MNTFLEMCGTACPNLKSCMPKEITLHTQCLKWAESTSAIVGILLLGNQHLQLFNLSLKWEKALSMTNPHILESTSQFSTQHTNVWSDNAQAEVSHHMNNTLAAAVTEWTIASERRVGPACGPPYRLWLLLLPLLLELHDGSLGLLQLSTGLLALLSDCGQLPLDQVVLLCLLGSRHLSLGT